MTPLDISVWNLLCFKQGQQIERSCSTAQGQPSYRLINSTHILYTCTFMAASTHLTCETMTHNFNKQWWGNVWTGSYLFLPIHTIFYKTSVILYLNIWLTDFLIFLSKTFFNIQNHQVKKGLIESVFTCKLNGFYSRSKNGNHIRLRWEVKKSSYSSAAQLGSEDLFYNSPVFLS